MKPQMFSLQASWEGGGIFRNVTNRRCKELNVNMKLGVIKCRQLKREGKSIALNSVS